jgi:hypothetical protein
MATIRLDAFSDETIVLHFGGPEGTPTRWRTPSSVLQIPPTQSMRRSIPAKK